MLIEYLRQKVKFEVLSGFSTKTLSRVIEKYARRLKATSGYADSADNRWRVLAIDEFITMAFIIFLGGEIDIAPTLCKRSYARLTWNL